MYPRLIRASLDWILKVVAKDESTTYAAASGSALVGLQARELLDRQY